ncbi:hypothetical protein Leryth_006433 [Lithospermum erythrorhizon]|nr:hypothetical protein Leryth_006433 [Lithospermum erythrorhizon]
MEHTNESLDPNTIAKGKGMEIEVVANTKTKKSVRWSQELVSESPSPRASSSATAPPQHDRSIPAPINFSASEFKSKVENVKGALGRWRKRVGEATMKAGDLAGNTWQHCEYYYGFLVSRGALSLILVIFIRNISHLILQQVLLDNRLRCFSFFYPVRTAPSFTDAAFGRIVQSTKVLAEGGYEKIFQQTFETVEGEELQNSFACFMSTSVGPVMGVLYVSTEKLAYCSDNPLSYKDNDDTNQWSYYKVTIPLHQLKAVNPSSSTFNPSEKYIQIISVDNQEFWFMGFLNYAVAVNLLKEVLEVGSCSP